MEFAQLNRDTEINEILNELKKKLAVEFDNKKPGWGDFLGRLDKYFPRLYEILARLYGERGDFSTHLDGLVRLMAKAWVERSEELKTLDESREKTPDWFQNHKMVGGVCYVDLFAGDLAGIREKISYFKELGLTYLHLMPLFSTPEGENDGGYAISSYRDVDPELGTMADLRCLSDELRKEGISLVLDFVFNHTSSDHEWALKARTGDPVYQEFYRMFPDRTMPDAYEASLREIFPEEHAGAFTYFEAFQKWVWTTFHSNQWDLNYANPEVFNRMASEMLFLANQGVEVLRLDAVAFIWKQLGTSCENLPEAHLIIQAYNAVARISAPALLFKSEAIVHPDEVNRYIKPEECQLSYNPLLMALLWNSLATRKVNLLRYSISSRYSINPGCSWVNYVRCHDDIGWTFSDEDAGALWINAYDHRKFLNEFYTGRFEGSFARGLSFQENPKTGDARISGTCASLAGLEKAINEETSVEVDLAIRRILILHNVILTIGGIPLIYLGDEVGTLNDYSYQADPEKADDSRWVHRSRAKAELNQQRNDLETVPGKIFEGLKHLIVLRQATPILSGGHPEIIQTGNQHVLGYIRRQGDLRLLVLNNFTEQQQAINAQVLTWAGLGDELLDLVTGISIEAGADLVLAPYQYVWVTTK